MREQFIPLSRELRQQPIATICYVTDRSGHYLEVRVIPTTEDEVLTPQHGERVSAALKELQEKYSENKDRVGEGFAGDFSAFRERYPELGQLTPETKIFKLIEVQP